MELIPAIDLKDGQAVRLYQGDFARLTVYDRDPVALAQRWAQAGARRIHVVDLDGARSGRPVSAALVHAMLQATSAELQLGGGLRSEQAVIEALDLGLARVVLGTAAVHDPALVARLCARFPERIIVGVDARDGLVATEGWTSTSHVPATELVEQMAGLGVREIIYTDIARDGTLSEPNYAALQQLIRPDGPAIVASGGVRSLEQLLRLAQSGVAAAIVGRALYTGDINLAEAIQALQRLRAEP